jgi:hypothetical protein
MEQDQEEWAEAPVEDEVEVQAKDLAGPNIVYALNVENRCHIKEECPAFR